MQISPLTSLVASRVSREAPLPACSVGTLPLGTVVRLMGSTGGAVSQRVAAEEPGDRRKGPAVGREQRGVVQPRAKESSSDRVTNWFRVKFLDT